MDRKRLFWSALIAGTLTACSGLNPVTPTVEAGGITPLPSPATEIAPAFADAFIGNNQVAPIPAESTDAGNFRMSVRACLETVNPNRECNDATDLPIKGATLNIIYHKNGLSQELVTAENGLGQGSAPFNEVADRVNRNGNESTEARIQIITPPLKLNVELPNGQIVEACMTGMLGHANDYDFNFDMGYSVDACDPVPAPFEESAGLGQIVN